MDAKIKNLCPRCLGTGIDGSSPCAGCGGTGYYGKDVIDIAAIMSELDYIHGKVTAIWNHVKPPGE